MRRMFWLTVGATVGVLVVRKVTRTAQAFTPAGLADRAGGIGESLRYFADQVRTGMAEREIELRDALGIDAVEVTTPAAGGTRRDGRHDLPPAEAADVIQHPTGIRRATG